MQCLIKFWSAQSIKTLVFIGNGFGSAEEEKADLHSATVKESLKHADFGENIQKTIWQPQKELIWFGVNVNLHKLPVTHTCTDSIFSLLKKIVKHFPKVIVVVVVVVVVEVMVVVVVVAVAAVVAVLVEVVVVSVVVVVKGWVKG